MKKIYVEKNKNMSPIDNRSGRKYLYGQPDNKNVDAVCYKLIEALMSGNYQQAFDLSETHCPYDRTQIWMLTHADLMKIWLEDPKARPIVLNWLSNSCVLPHDDICRRLNRGDVWIISWGNDEFLNAMFNYPDTLEETAGDYYDEDLDDQDMETEAGTDKYSFRLTTDSED